ncbi:MAG: biotin synthase BioB [Flavobacteriales bacterium]|nr:biotin synthase BioB [Flavobacteriales bacterium]
MEAIRHNWTREEVLAVYNRPLIELMYDAATVHRQYHDPREVQVSTLVSIKTGGCSEDCGYCSQAARYKTKIDKNDLMSVEQVKEAAIKAKAAGSSRVCMGAAWRNVKDNEEFDQVLEMVRTVYDLDLEVCCTLGMVTEHQAKRLASAGLYAYNHNLDTSEEHYREIISTRGYSDRLQTLENARKANLTVCSGGIIGMGEKPEDRCAMLVALANLDPHPESVPINALVAVEGTPLEDCPPTPVWDMVRMIATARIVLPATTVRLSAGRTQMTPEGQALCFMAGAGSIFSGDRLLTTPNPDIDSDTQLFAQLGLVPKAAYKDGDRPKVDESYKERQAQSEHVKWSRPGHSIARNVEKSIRNLKTKEV